MAPGPTRRSLAGGIASIGRVPKLRLILVAGAAAGTLIWATGCGGGGPKPSIPADEAGTLLAKIQEIQSNVENGSCFVAGDRTDDLISDIESLPSSVNSDVKRALDNGAKQLRILVSDPDQCQGRTTSTTTSTTTPSTESTTTTPTRSTTTTRTQTTTPTQTQPPPPTVTSGGIGPGGTSP
jgi:hypothetical protein